MIFPRQLQPQPEIHLLYAVLCLVVMLVLLR